MKKRYRNYSQSFKQKAVELSFLRNNVKQICEELDIPSLCFTSLVKKPNTYGKNSSLGRGKTKLTVDQKEIVALKKQLEDISIENEILKKTVSIFFKSDK